MAIPSTSGALRLLTQVLKALLLCAVALPSIAHSEAWVITDSHHPVQSPAGVRIILLDDSERLQDKLSEHLPADPQQGMAIAQQRLRSTDGVRLQKDLTRAQQGIADAWSLGITKVPAVVVDRKYVVYGESNVSVAMQLISNYREMHP
ncbi:TIGR03757 family integrating conjugative element protein [Pseudomonas sp. NPDC088368]|uniref:TIGR03757 family integrating conjugative element protein n=1 Tax=Pseudomonas sp. NPDC088368 TaxID=3364453 RepID=UPI003822B833